MAEIFTVSSAQKWINQNSENVIPQLQTASIQTPPQITKIIFIPYISFMWKLDFTHNNIFSIYVILGPAGGRGAFSPKVNMSDLTQSGTIL